MSEPAVSTGASTRRVRSAERVAALLDALRDSAVPLRHGEVARALGLPKSSATNLLDTLADSGLVTRDSRGYSLGVKLIQLGAAAAERLDIRDVALPIMSELCESGVGTANLAVLRGHDVLYLEKLNNPKHVIQIATRVGGVAPAHATALGKVLVAALPEPERERWLGEHRFAPLTEHTIISAEAFRQALEFADVHGYALDDEEQSLRIVCVAAPVRDHSGDAVAAVSLTCLGVDIADCREAQIAAVKSGAARISQTLGAASC